MSFSSSDDEAGFYCKTETLRVSMRNPFVALNLLMLHCAAELVQYSQLRFRESKERKSMFRGRRWRKYDNMKYNDCNSSAVTQCSLNRHCVHNHISIKNCAIESILAKGILQRIQLPASWRANRCGSYRPAKLSAIVRSREWKPSGCDHILSICRCTSPAVTGRTRSADSLWAQYILHRFYGRCRMHPLPIFIVISTFAMRIGWNVLGI